MSLGDKTAQGFVYTLAQFGGVKIVNLLGQFALSWILVSRDFGHISKAYLVAGFASLVTQAGIRDVLIRRWKEFDRWATPAFWMSVALGALSTTLMALIAPLAGWFFKDPMLPKLILILACQNIFVSMSIVPEARLNIDLRFRTLSIINFVCSSALTILSVIFAWMGFHAYSFILPWPLMAMLRAAIVWSLARPKVHLRPHISLWRHLFGDNALLLAAWFFLMITYQCDYLILGRLYPNDDSIVGRYFWAFNLSTQALQLLAMNVGSLLLPSLSKLQDDPQRQRNAFVRAGKALMLLAGAGCLLQAAVADPLIRIAFKPEWYPAIPIVQVLSIGWVLFAMNFPALTALKAQGRFVTLLWFTIGCCAIFLPVVYAGAKIGEWWGVPGIGAAVGVAVYSVVCGPASVYVAIRPAGGTWRDTAEIFVVPACAGVVAFGIAVALASAIPNIPGRNYLKTLVIIGVGSAAYAGIVLKLARPAALDLWYRMKGLIKRPAAQPEPLSTPATKAAS